MCGSIQFGLVFGQKVRYGHFFPKLCLAVAQFDIPDGEDTAQNDGGNADQSCFGAKGPASQEGWSALFDAYQGSAGIGAADREAS